MIEDYFGQTIFPGDEIVYPVATSGNLYLSRGKVDSIEEDGTLRVKLISVGHNKPVYSDKKVILKHPNRMIKINGIIKEANDA